MGDTITKKKEVLRFALIAIVLLAILGGFILYLSWPMLTGTTVILATRPIDPFDPFRGQYIIINYEISAVPSITSAKAGDTVYISLREDDAKVWRYKSASLKAPKEGIAIAGKITSIYGDTMRVEYGIEQYFFERHAELPETNLTVEAKISASGTARITRLLQEGKPVELKYRNLTVTS